MSILLRRRTLMLHRSALEFIADGAIYRPFTFTKSGTNSSYSASNGKIVFTTYDNSTSAYSRVVAVSQDAINLSPYKSLKVLFHYANNTYGASVFRIGVGTENGNFEEYSEDERRTREANGVELSLDLSGISGNKHIVLYNSTVQSSAQQGSRYTITKIWLE